MNTLMRKNPDFLGSWMDDWFKPTEFNRNFSMPAVNIKETETDYQVEVAAPGLNKEDFNIEVKEDILKLSASKSSQSEEKTENYARREFGFRKFERSFLLPKNSIQIDGIQANYEQGILKIKLPKQETKEAVTTVTVQ